MQNQSCVPYRGYAIDVRVSVSTSPSMDGQQVHYSAGWSILSSDPLATPVVSLPETLSFVTPEAGFAYAERQAKRFIDGCINESGNEGESC